MSFTSRVKRSLIGVAAGAMVLSLMPAGAAFAGTAEVCANAEDAGFTDVTEDGVHSDNINCMSAYGVGQGLTDGSYGVYQNLSRGQAASLLAAFAVAATDGAILDDVDETEDVPFEDIDGSAHEANIEILYRLDLIAGTSATTYSPNAAITRGQFATILRNAHDALGIDFPTDLEAQFDDVDGTTHEEAINQLADADIISGVSATMYAPNDFVTRGQTASLLALSAGVLDDAGLWLAPRLGAPDTNQTFTVTPTDEAINTVSTLAGQDSDRGVRTYSAEVGNVTSVDVALIPSGNVSVDANGVVSFADSDPAQANNRADDLGDPGADAFITTVNGVSTTGDPAYVNDVTPNNGVVTFEINSTDANVAVIPVVLDDADSNNQLNLDADNEPTEDFGIGGAKTWMPADAVADTYDVESRIVRADLDTFSAEGTRSLGAPGDFRFDYDSGDTFQYDSIANFSGFSISMDDFEEWHSGSLNADGTQRANGNTTGTLLDGDRQLINYNPGTSSSTFSILVDEPNAVTDINAQPGTVPGATISVTWTAPTNPNMHNDAAEYQIWRAPVTDSGVQAYALADTIDAIDANDDPVEQYNDSDGALVPGATYAYRVVPFGVTSSIGGSAEGPESAAAQATVPATEFPQAPVSEVIFIDDNDDAGDPGPDGLLNDGDTITIVYRNTPIELSSPSMTLADDTGTRAVVDSSNANFSVGGLDDEQLIITMTGTPSVTQTMPTAGGSALEIPAAIVSASGISNADAAWSLAESGLDLYSLTGGQEDRVVGTTNGFLSSEVAPIDITANPDNDTVSVLDSATAIDDGDPFTVFDGLGVSIGSGTYDAANGTTITTDGFVPGDRLYFVYDDRDQFGPFGPTNLFASVPSATTIISNPTDVPSIFDVAAEGTGTTDTIQVTWQDNDIPPGSITQVGDADDYQVYDAGNNVLVADGVTATVTSSDTVEVTLDADLDVGTSYVLRVPDATVQDPNNLPNVAESFGFTVTDADITAPEVVSITGASGDGDFVVEFDEALDPASVQNTDFIHSGGTVTGTTLSAGDTTVTVTVSPNLAPGDVIGVSAGTVTDLAGNAGPTTTQTETIAAGAGPTVNTINATDKDTTFEVVFDAAVGGDALDATSVQNGDFIFSAGTITGHTVVGQTVTVDVSQALAPGDTVGVAANSVTNVDGDPGPAANETEVVANTTNPTSTSATIADNDGDSRLSVGDVITLEFDEPMDTTPPPSGDGISYNGGEFISSVTEADYVWTNNTTLTITINVTSVCPTPANCVLGNDINSVDADAIQDAAGNDWQLDGDVTLDDPSAPTITADDAVAGDAEFTITFNEPLDVVSAQDVTNYTVRYNGTDTTTVLSAVAVAGANGTTDVTLVIGTALVAGADMDQTVDDESNNTASQTAYLLL